MDTSETYIKMCEKAVEIQSPNYHRENGDVIAHMDFGSLGKWEIAYVGNCDVGCDHDNCILDSMRQIIVWLPRQDQLQEMVPPVLSDDDPERTLTEILYRSLNNFVDSGVHDYSQEFSTYARQFSSMEQLWLAFVMREKYNKVWNGEDWVL